MEPSDNRASPFGKFSPEANVVIRKSAGFTRGSPPIVNCAAAGSAVAATRAETHPCLSEKQTDCRTPNAQNSILFVRFLRTGTE
jgi:hypothetical protein